MYDNYGSVDEFSLTDYVLNVHTLRKLIFAGTRFSKISYLPDFHLKLYPLTLFFCNIFLLNRRVILKFHYT